MWLEGRLNQSVCKAPKTEEELKKSTAAHFTGCVFPVFRYALVSWSWKGLHLIQCLYVLPLFHSFTPAFSEQAGVVVRLCPSCTTALSRSPSFSHLPHCTGPLCGVLASRRCSNTSCHGQLPEAPLRPYHCAAQIPPMRPKYPEDKSLHFSAFYGISSTN